MFKLNNLRAPIGSNHAPLRKGKGIGSGLGKTAGKGHKGQKARAGGTVGPSFEGGQVPLERRLPKVGFRSQLKFNKVRVNLSDLGNFKGRELKAKDIVPKSYGQNPRLYIAIEGTNAPKDFPKSLEAHKVAPKTREILEKNGVKITIQAFMDGARSVRPVKVKKKKT